MGYNCKWIPRRTKKRRCVKIALIVSCLMKNVNSKELFGKNLLDLWLENVSKIADKIVILDNNSNDGTLEKVINNKKVVCEISELDFLRFEQHLHSELWNLVRRNAKEGDMILILASDEFIDDTLIKNKKDLISFEYPCKEFFVLNVVHIWNKKDFRVDSSYGFKLSHRLFRFHDEPFSLKPLKDGLHNSAFPDYVIRLKDGNILNSCILHYGYSDEEQRKEKHSRYMDYSLPGSNKNAVSTLINPNPKLLSLNSLKKMMKNYDAILSQNEWDEIKGLMLN